MYSTPYILKAYILINLLFLILLLANDLNIYLIIVHFFSIYLGSRTIYCMIEGGCYYDVIKVFLFFFLGNLLTFLYIRNYIPNTIIKFFTKFSKKKFDVKEKIKARHKKLEDKIENKL
jgi:hypothetical protein